MSTTAIGSAARAVHAQLRGDHGIELARHTGHTSSGDDRAPAERGVRLLGQVSAIPAAARY